MHQHVCFLFFLGFVRNAERAPGARSPEWMGQDVLPAGSHRLTAARNKSGSTLAGRLSPVMQKQGEEGKHLIMSAGGGQQRQ